VALKEIKTPTVFDSLPHFLLRELDILEKLKGHNNIVAFHSSFVRNEPGDSKVYLCFEFVDGGDLSDLLRG
jgi:serine/threonine protein kinase